MAKVCQCEYEIVPQTKSTQDIGNQLRCDSTHTGESEGYVAGAELHSVPIFRSIAILGVSPPLEKGQNTLFLRLTSVLRNNFLPKP